MLLTLLNNVHVRQPAKIASSLGRTSRLVVRDVTDGGRARGRAAPCLSYPSKTREATFVNRSRQVHIQLRESHRIFSDLGNSPGRTRSPNARTHGITPNGVSVSQTSDCPVLRKRIRFSSPRDKSPYKAEVSSNFVEFRGRLEFRSKLDKAGPPKVSSPSASSLYLLDSFPRLSPSSAFHNRVKS